MTIKECYDAMGADYQNTLNRFQNEAFIKIFVLKYTRLVFVEAENV